MNKKEQKVETIVESTFVGNTVLDASCLYCKQGSTEKHPMLFRVYAPGEYWQHWDFENGGCDKNTNNINPNGVSVKRISS